MGVGEGEGASQYTEDQVLDRQYRSRVNELLVPWVVALQLIYIAVWSLNYIRKRWQKKIRGRPPSISTLLNDYICFRKKECQIPSIL